MRESGSVCTKFWQGAIVALLCICCMTAAPALAAGTWQHELTLYGWYAGIDGTVQFPGPLGVSSDFTVDASDILDNLNMIFMGGWRTKYNKWSFIADVIYMDVSGGDTKTVTPGASGVTVDASLDLDVTTWMLNGGLGYDVVQTDQGTLTLVGGVRYLDIDVDAQANFPGSIKERSQSDGLLDGIFGVSGAINFNKHWFLPFHADVGAGGSELTWQLYAAIGYRFGWGDIRLGYRYLSYDLDDDFIMQDMDLSGPLLGIGFTF